MRFNLKRIFLNFYFVLQIFVVSIGLLCSSFSYSKTNIAKENIPSEVDEVKNSVVRLELKLKKAPARSGTGFILEDGVLVTNFHVLKGLLSKKKLLNKEKLSNKITPDFLSQIKILQEGQFLDVQVTSVQALDSVHDLALVNIKGSKIPPAIKKPKEDLDLTKEQLFLVGYPRKKLKAIGQKGPIEIFEWEDHAQAQMPISSFFSVNNLPGASGSPIVNQRGELMGVLNSYSPLEKKIIFSNNDSLFSLRNSEYGAQCSKNISIKDCFQQMEDFRLKEAEKGNAYAQYKLSLWSSKDTEVLKWLKLAAQQGFVLAQSEIGHMFLQESLYEKAVKWLDLAAQQGHGNSAFQLGKMYHQGNAVPKDSKKGIEYLELAAQVGHKEAQEYLNKLHKNRIKDLKIYKNF